MRSLLHCACLLVLSGCAAAPAETEIPARLVEPSAEGRAELLAAVTSVLDVGTATLAPDALLAANTLIIERTQARDASGRQLSGRDFGRPQHFRLVKHGTHCVLIHDESGTRTVLTKVSCTPLS